MFKWVLKISIGFLIFFSAEFGLTNNEKNLSGLLKHYSNLLRDGGTYENGGGQLHLMAERGNLKQVKYLLQNGSDVNEKDKNGNTPLMRAVNPRMKKQGHSGMDSYPYVYYNTYPIVKTLIENGANIHAINKNNATVLDLFFFSIQEKYEVHQMVSITNRIDRKRLLNILLKNGAQTNIIELKDHFSFPSYCHRLFNRYLD